MMPLTLANTGEENLIRRVGGNGEVKKHLEDLGVVAGAPVSVVAALGGKDNLLEVDNCFTRLRLKVKDNTKIDQATLKNQTGASGVMIKGQIVQVIYGLKINAVRRAVDEELSK